MSSLRLWTTFDGVYRTRRWQGKNKKKRKRERRGDDGKERRGEDRKREEDNAANSRCLLACPFLLFFSHSRSLLFVAISSKEIIPTLTYTHILGSLFVLSHSPRSGEHEFPYSDATSEDQLKQMTSSRGRGGSLIAGVSLRSPLQIIPINYDRYPATSHRRRGA